MTPVLEDEGLDELERLARAANDKVCWKSASLALETLHKKLSAQTVLALISALRQRGEEVEAKNAAINTFCMHFIFAHDGSSDFSDLRREEFREAVADLARAALSPPKEI